MANKNDDLENMDQIFDENTYLSEFDELEAQIQGQLDDEFQEFEFLKDEKEKIGNPEELGKVVLDEVWKQIGNQIGLDITNETLIQKYDREHPETYSEVGKKVMQDERYKNANKEMKTKQQSGNLTDEYTGKNLGKNDKANLDHVVSRKELYENQRRKQANIATEDLANKKENLKPTNEALNKSKNSKSIDEYISKREEREKALRAENEKKNKKIDESNMSEADKKLQKEKNNKRLQDKLDADDELMKKADKEARKAINKDIAKGAVKEVGKKAGIDALKQMAVMSLFSLLKEIINSLVSFFKSKEKSFRRFLDEMKNALHRFFSKITSVLQTGASSMIGTIVSEIFGPIVSTFKKLASLIKQGISSVMEAVKYLTNKENKDKPFSVKIAQVGKIITSGLVAGGAIFLGEAIEKVLLTVPGMQTPIPLVGTLANIIGMFLGSLTSGVIGAVVINLIDKWIANKQKNEATKKQVDKGSEVLNTQKQLYTVVQEKQKYQKKHAVDTIKNRHEYASNTMKDMLKNIEKNCKEDESIQNDFDDIEDLFSELED